MSYNVTARDSFIFIISASISSAVIREFTFILVCAHHFYQIERTTEENIRLSICRYNGIYFKQKVDSEILISKLKKALERHKGVLEMASLVNRAYGLKLFASVSLVQITFTQLLFLMTNLNTNAKFAKYRPLNNFQFCWNLPTALLTIMVIWTLGRVSDKVSEKKEDIYIFSWP
jgi:hypothetical protein